MAPLVDEKKHGSNSSTPFQKLAAWWFVFQMWFLFRYVFVFIEIKYIKFDLIWDDFSSAHAHHLFGHHGRCYAPTSFGMIVTKETLKKP